MLYEGAIHMVQSTPYQVEKLDWVGRTAYVTRTHADYYTDAIDYPKLKVLERLDGCIAGAGSAGHGEVHVLRRVAGYKKIRYYTHENIGYGPVNLPDQELHTTAAWWQLPEGVLESAFASRQDALDGFLGAAHALHVVARVAVMAESRDLARAVGSGDGAWFAQADGRGRGAARPNWCRRRATWWPAATARPAVRPASVRCRPPTRNVPTPPRGRWPCACWACCRRHERAGAAGRAAAPAAATGRRQSAAAGPALAGPRAA